MAETSTKSREQLQGEIDGLFVGRDTVTDAALRRAFLLGRTVQARRFTTYDAGTEPEDGGGDGGQGVIILPPPPGQTAGPG